MTTRKRSHHEEVNKVLLGHCRAVVMDIQSVLENDRTITIAFLTCDRHIVTDCAAVSSIPHATQEDQDRAEHILSQSTYIVDRAHVLLVAFPDLSAKTPWKIGDTLFVRPSLTKSGGLATPHVAFEVVQRREPMASTEITALLLSMLRSAISSDFVGQFFSTYRTPWTYLLESGPAALTPFHKELLGAMLVGISKLGFPATAKYLYGEILAMCVGSFTLPEGSESFFLLSHDTMPYMTWKDLRRSSSGPCKGLCERLAKGEATPYRVIGIAETGDFLIATHHISRSALFLISVRVTSTDSVLYWFASESISEGTFRLVQGRPRELATFLQMQVVAEEGASGVQGLLVDDDDSCSVSFMRERQRGWTHPPQQRHIDALPMTRDALQQTVERALLEVQSVCVVGPSGTGKSHVLAEVLSHMHRLRKTAAQEVMKEQIARVEVARRRLREKTAPVEVCAAYNDIIDVFSSIISAQKSQAILVVSDVKSAALRTATLSKTLQACDIASKKQVTRQELPVQHLTALRAKKAALLQSIAKTIAHCSGPHRMPLTAALAVQSTRELFDAVGILSQATLDQWLGIRTAELEPVPGPHAALFDVPPSSGSDVLPALSKENVWEITSEGRREYAGLCCEVAVRSLCEWYDEVVNDMRCITEIIREVKVDRSSLNEVSGGVLMASTQELCLPHVRDVLEAVGPDIAVVEDGGTITPAALSALLPSRVRCVAVSSRRPYILDVTVHMQQQWRHSDEVRAFINAAAAGMKKGDQDYEFAMQSISATTSIGIAEKTYVWTCAVPSRALLIQMAMGLSQYILDSKGLTSFALLVPSKVDATDFSELRTNPGSVVCSIDDFIGCEADVVVLAVLGNLGIETFLSAISCAKFRVYAVCWSGWSDEQLPPRLRKDANFYGPAIHLICDRHNQPKPIFVEYEIDGEAYTYTFHMPRFGRWCTLICMQTFTPAPGMNQCSASHVCDKVCMECDHIHNVCPHPCERSLPCGHPCTKPCSQPCGSCSIQTVVEVPCSGTKVLIGYDVHTRNACFQTFSHYQEVLCGTALQPCKELTTKVCEGCANEVKSACSGEVPTQCFVCERMGPLVRELTKEKTLLLQKQRALDLHKVPNLKCEQVDVCQKVCDQWRRTKAKYVTASQEVASTRNAKSLQFIRGVQAKSEAAKREYQESTAFLEEFLRGTYLDHCSNVRQLVRDQKTVT